MNKRYKIAAIKFGGMCAGGTEKWLQTILVELSKKPQFDVDYYYCDAAPYVGSDYKHADTDQSRLDYVKNSAVNLVKFKVGLKNINTPTHDWLMTDFWEKFREEKYDLILSARAGHAEYPFTQINTKPIVDFITLPGMAERKENSKASIHISRFQADSWIAAGGDSGRAVVIPLFSDIGTVPPKDQNLRKLYNIPETAVVYGLHQRVDDGIFSPVPLTGYKQIEGDDTWFMLMGGGESYSEQAKKLGIKNFVSVKASGDYADIFRF